MSARKPPLVSLAAALAVLCGAAPAQLDAPAPAAPAALRAGTALERRMAGGESHAYGMEARPRVRTLVTVEQQGIDVVVEALGPDGRVLVAVDAPTDRDGPESLLLPPEAAGPVEIRVRSPHPRVGPGEYVLRLEELAEATPAERERVEAERLTTAAAAANFEGSAESRRRGAALYLEVRALWQALGRPREEARCTLSAAEMHAALGEPKSALDLFRQALAQFEELADEPLQAAAWSGIGVAQVALGDPADGAESQRRALELERRLGRPHQEGKALNNLGHALHSGGELREAADFYERALAVFRRAGERGAWEAAVLQNLAAVYIGLGEPEAALARNRPLLELYRELGDPLGEAQMLNNLGVLYANLGRLGEALESYTAALAVFRRAGDRRWEASVLHNRGAAFYALGDYPRALADQEEALALRRDAGDRRGEVASEIAVGTARFRLGEIGRALEIGRRAAAAAVAASDRRGEMLARRLVGRAAVASSDPSALSELARALDLARALEDRLEEALILQLVGRAHLALGEPERAVEVLSPSVELARAVKSPSRLIGALTALAVAERRLGRPAAARARVEEALGVVEIQRVAETDPDLRASFLAAQHDAFELEIDLLMELEGREPGSGHVERAFEVAERARARSLLDLLQEARADVRAGVDPDLREHERGLLVRLNAKASRLADLRRRPGSAERERAAEAEVRAVLDELAGVRAEIRRRSPRYAALTEPPAASSREIQALLDADTLLLEYSLGEERSFLWAVDRDSVAGHVLPGRAEIEAAARELYGRLSVLGTDDGGLEQAAARLGRMLLDPVAGRLGERRLVVVADGELQYLPFAALPDPGAGGEPLLVRHEVVHAPSASAVALQRRLARATPAPGLVAVLADPVFDPADPRVADRGEESRPAAAAPLGAAVAPVRSTLGGPLVRLPWTRREAEAIAALAPAGRSLLALDFRASRETALSPELAGYRIVHFATHGLIDAETPALSGLMLSRVGEDGAPREGFLGLGDVYNLRLGADLVVLSGCETALGKEVRGEGLVGLTQGFFYTGASQVVASLWRVEDRATAELISRFYRSLVLDGGTPAASLRGAQLAIRQDLRWRSPYYWSGFVLQGDWAGGIERTAGALRAEAPAIPPATASEKGVQR